MTKLSDLEQEERRGIEDLLESKATALGFDSYEAYSTGSDYKLLKDLIGICANCKSLQYCKTEFNNVFANCAHYEMKLSGNNRIVECNCHNPRGILSLEEMYSLAILIDPNKKEIRGFITHHKKVVEKNKDDDFGNPLL